MVDWWLVGYLLLVVCLLSLGGLLKVSSERVIVGSLVFQGGTGPSTCCYFVLAMARCLGCVGRYVVAWLAG